MIWLIVGQNPKLWAGISGFSLLLLAPRAMPVQLRGIRYNPGRSGYCVYIAR